MSALWNIWNSLSQGLREGIVAGTVGTLAAAFVLGVLKVSGFSIRALFRRIFQTQQQPTPPPAPHVTINIPPAAFPPQALTPPALSQPTISAPSIPKPPVVGFVARRDKDGHDIVELLKKDLSPESNLLIALWGEGGIGKTTLAAEAVRQLIKDYDRRILWTSAEKRSDFTYLTFLDEIAIRLDRKDVLPFALDPKTVEVQMMLAATPALVVLDNFETISPDEGKHCAEFLAHKASCSGIITTREQVAGARNIRIDAMSPDEAKEFLGRIIGQYDPGSFSGVDGERLMRTAGLNPLVMEWLTAQIALAQKPDDVLEDLSHGKGDAAQRVFDRSFNLPQLGDDGRSVLLALSLFVPSASRKALAAVSGFGDDKNRLNETVKRLAALRLITAADEGERLLVQGLTRELAKARLAEFESEQAHQIRQRFVSYFVRYSEAHPGRVAQDFDVLEAERDNIFSSIGMAFTMKNWAHVVQIMDAINYDGVRGYLTVRGYWEEAIRRGQQGLAAASNLNDDVKVASFSHKLAMRHFARGNLSEAERLYKKSLEILKRRDDRLSMSGSLHELGRLAHHKGDSYEAQRLYQEALNIYKDFNHAGGIANELHQLALLADERQEVEEARKLFREVLEIRKKLFDQTGSGSALLALASLERRSGNSDQARRLCAEGLRVAREVGHQELIASALHLLALLAHDAGNRDQARELYKESLEISKELGAARNIATTLHNMGRLAEVEGDNKEATRFFVDSLAIFERLKSPKAEIARQSLERVTGKVA